MSNEHTFTHIKQGDIVLFQERGFRGAWKDPIEIKVTKVARKYLYVEKYGRPLALERETGRSKSHDFGYGIYERIVTVEMLEDEKRRDDAITYSNIIWILRQHTLVDLDRGK